MKEGTIMKKLLYISVNSKPEDLSASKTVARKFINKKDYEIHSLLTGGEGGIRTLAPV